MGPSLNHLSSTTRRISFLSGTRRLGSDNRAGCPSYGWLAQSGSPSFQRTTQHFHGSPGRGRRSLKGGSEIRFRLTFRVRHLFGERRFPQSVFRFDHLSTPASGETQGLPLGRTKTRAGKHSVTGRSTTPIPPPYIYIRIYIYMGHSRWLWVPSRPDSLLRTRAFMTPKPN